MKNKTKRIMGITCLILLIILVQAIGVTYAKYIASEKGNAKADIAQWSFEIVKDGEQIKTINLGDTIVNDFGTIGKLAPGKYGAFGIQLDASDSDVDVEYTLSFANEKNKPDNLEFVFNGVTYNSINDIKYTGTIKSDQKVKSQYLSVMWRWAYETGQTKDEIAKNDVIDTEDANSNAEYTFDIIATGTQAK